MIASTDVVCYKVVHEYADGNFRAPFKFYEYKAGAENNCPYFFIDVSNKPFSKKYGFHSFQKKEDAFFLKETLDKIHGNQGWNFVVVECTIPKWGSYYSGKVLTGYTQDVLPDEYCSNSITIKEKVKK